MKSEQHKQFLLRRKHMVILDKKTKLKNKKWNKSKENYHE